MFIYVENNKIIGCGEVEILTEGIENISITDDILSGYILNPDKYMYKDNKIIENPDWQEIKQQQQREQLDLLTLTASDVERALYKAKGMDFEDLKEWVKLNLPEIDIKALSIEFRAKDFYRGAKLANGVRLFDTIGLLMGYSSEDMDYLFLNKELPVK